MKQSSPEKPAPSGNAILARLSEKMAWLFSHSLRDVWWGFLDLFEKHRRVRWSLYIILTLLVAGVGIFFVWKPWWTKRNAADIAQQWLDAGKINHAAVAAQNAIHTAPDLPESWRVAAEVARRRGQKSQAVYASGIGAQLDPENTTLVLTWASDALLNDQPAIAIRALDLLSDEALDSSAWAQRIAGEVDRRSRDLASARAHFEQAIMIEGPLAVNQVPLGIILLNNPYADDYQQGVALLRKWANDPDWGVTVVRTLLGEALKLEDKATMLHWAEKLRAHPRCTINDIPNCLLALSLADEARFIEVISAMKQAHSATATDAAQLIGWLNRIGQTPVAIQWIGELPVTITHTLPLPPIIAETLRLNESWSDLQTWSESGNWGPNLDSLRIAYGLLAAQQTQQPALTDSLWQTLQRQASANGGRALFVANAIYTWDMQDEALTLLWSAAEQTGSSYQALGTLARHYQTKRDAEGQYRVFRQLHNLRSSDPNIANNLAFFTTLTGNSIKRAQELAKDNFHRFPQNEAYRATYAYILTTRGQHSHASSVIHSISSKWPQSPAIAFAYGLHLANTDRKEEAQKVLFSINPATLTQAEVDLIKSALE